MGQQLSEVFCLHTSKDGGVQAADGFGRAVEFTGLSSAGRPPAGTYRVIGVPHNYGLITELYSALSRIEDEDWRILVGSPEVGAGCQESLQELLYATSFLHVHDCQVFYWNSVDPATFNNYLLLQHYQENHTSDLVNKIYAHHRMRHYFNFLNIPVDKAIAVVNAIVEPRWFINPARPLRTSKVESFFGLHPRQISNSWKPGTIRVKQAMQGYRTYVLLDAIQELPDDSVLSREADSATRRFTPSECDKDLVKARLLLRFMFRNWLDVIMRPGHFQADKFFNREDTLQDFYRFSPGKS